MPAAAILFAAASLFVSCQKESRRSATETETEDSAAEVEETDEGAPADPAKEALAGAYPDFIRSIDGNTVTFTDGTTMQWDDGREKDFLTRLDECDIEDMFAIPYRHPDPEPEYLEDAGRMRSEALFKKMYGSTEAQVRANLTDVAWAGSTVQFNSRNGAADSLRAVAREVAADASLKPYLKSSGTFNWRPVRGAKRMSAHSYGIAFDIAVDKADYWQWKSGSTDELKHYPYANRIPRRLVEIFRRHGFIWGGAWYHYDTMHFEFRPEILLHALLLAL